MLIRTKDDLRCAYDLLAILEERGGELFTEKTKELKQSIRQYQNKKNLFDGAVVIMDDGDHLLSLVPLPEDLQTEEEADSFFMGRLFRECKPSQYDCTGQIFTCWYKLVRRQGRFWAYHQMAMDV